MRSSGWAVDDSAHGVVEKKKRKKRGRDNGVVPLGWSQRVNWSGVQGGQATFRRWPITCRQSACCHHFLVPSKRREGLIPFSPSHTRLASPLHSFTNLHPSFTLHHSFNNQHSLPWHTTTSKGNGSLSPLRAPFIFPFIALYTPSLLAAPSHSPLLFFMTLYYVSFLRLHIAASRGVSKMRVI